MIAQQHRTWTRHTGTHNVDVILCPLRTTNVHQQVFRMQHRMLDLPAVDAYLTTFPTCKCHLHAMKTRAIHTPATFADVTRIAQSKVVERIDLAQTLGEAVVVTVMIMTACKDPLRNFEGLMRREHSAHWCWICLVVLLIDFRSCTTIAPRHIDAYVRPVR